MIRQCAAAAELSHSYKFRLTAAVSETVQHVIWGKMSVREVDEVSESN